MGSSCQTYTKTQTEKTWQPGRVAAITPLLDHVVLQGGTKSIIISEITREFPGCSWWRALLGQQPLPHQWLQSHLPPGKEWT